MTEERQTMTDDWTAMARQYAQQRFEMRELEIRFEQLRDDLTESERRHSGLVASLGRVMDALEYPAGGTLVDRMRENHRRWLEVYDEVCEGGVRLSEPDDGAMYEGDREVAR